MSSPKYVPILFQELHILTVQIRLMDIMCNILFILGIIGNVMGLLLFSSSRRTCRISSIYAFLASCSSIINLLCVIRYTSILHSTLRHSLRELIGQIWWACKLYECSFSFRIMSSWITLFWMFERVMCVSKRLRRIFNRCNSFQLKFIIPIVMMSIILGWTIGPPVYFFQPQIVEKKIINSTTNIVEKYCQLYSKASVQWQKYFQETHFGMNHFTIRCLFSELIPTGIILLFNSYIIYHVVRTSRRLHKTNSRQLCREQFQTTSWMNIILILHSSLFLFSLFFHIIGHFMPITVHETWWVSFTILTNCSLSFYIYCLSGKAFRTEIRRIIQRSKTQICGKLHACQDR